MKYLVWDTSSKTGSLAAFEWKETGRNGLDDLNLVSEWTLNLDSAAHSERLLWSIHQLLEAAKWTLDDVDCFGVGVGPGSFTGLRIGLTTARTLSHTLKKKLIGVSSLAALVRPAAAWYSESSAETWIIGATDAAKGELFTIYGRAKDLAQCAQYPAIWKKSVYEQVITPKKLIDELTEKFEKKQAKNPIQWMVLGEARTRYPELWDQLPKKIRISPRIIFQDQIQARSIGALVWEAMQSGQVQDALDVHPRYLRDSDAEVKLKAGLLPEVKNRVKGTA